MKKKKIMYIIAAVCFGLILLNSLGMIVLRVAQTIIGSSVVAITIRNILLFDLFLLIGAALGIAGSVLAIKNKAPVILPIACIAMTLPQISDPIILINSGFRAFPVFLPYLLMITAGILIILDGFIRPKVRAMGIIGAALAMVTTLLDLIMSASNFIDMFSRHASHPAYYLMVAASLAFVLSYGWFAIAALMNALAREPRTAKAVRAPMQYVQPYAPQHENNAGFDRPENYVSDTQEYDDRNYRY